MKKNIVLPIIAALMSVVVAVGAALMVQDMTDGNIWYKVRVSSGHSSAFMEEHSEEELTVHYIESKEDLMKFNLDCSAYHSKVKLAFAEKKHIFCERRDIEFCCMPRQIRRYNRIYFRKKALIMFEVSCLEEDQIAIDSIYIENNTLMISVYMVDFISLTSFRSQYNTVFLEMNKSDLNNITDIKVTVEEIDEYDLPKDKKVLVSKEEKKFDRRFYY